MSEFQFLHRLVSIEYYHYFLFLSLKWFLVVSIFILLSTNDIEHLFMSLMVIVCLLWWNVYWNHFPIFNVVVSHNKPDEKLQPFELRKSHCWSYKCLSLVQNKLSHGLVVLAGVLCAKSLQSCPPLCDPVDFSPPGSSVHGILQARILEWAAISFSGDLPDPGIQPLSPA